MQIELYVGVDVSKPTLDVFIHDLQVHRQFKNNQSGYVSILDWVRTCTKQSLDRVLICFEHTGIYSMPFAVFLEMHRIAFAMVSPLEIKRSMGIVRGKNDLVDAKRVCLSVS